MSGVASQSKVLESGEVFQLPPYADELIFEATSALTVNVSSDNDTFFPLVGGQTTAISNVSDSKYLYEITGSVLHYIKFSGACTLYYRVSKR